MYDVLSTIQAFADNFDAAHAGEALGSMTKAQLGELQKTLSVQLEELQKADEDPNKERKRENLKKLRALVQETLRGTLHNLLISTLSDALSSQYGEITPEVLDSVGATPEIAEALKPGAIARAPSRGEESRVSAFDDSRSIVRQAPLPIVGEQVQTEKNSVKTNMSFAEYSQEVNPAGTMPNFLVGLRYFLLYKPFEFFRGMFGSRAPERKNVERKVAYVSADEVKKEKTEKKEGEAKKATEEKKGGTEEAKPEAKESGAPKTPPKEVKDKNVGPDEDPFKLDLDPDAFGGAPKSKVDPARPQPEVIETKATRENLLDGKVRTLGGHTYVFSTTPGTLVNVDGANYTGSALGIIDVDGKSISKDVKSMESTEEGGFTITWKKKSDGVWDIPRDEALVLIDTVSRIQESENVKITFSKRKANGVSVPQSRTISIKKL